jgi:hypothetical protein
MAGNRDLGEGRFHKAMEKYFCLLRMAEHLYQQTHYLDFYYGFACEIPALQMIRHIVACSEISGEDIDRIADHLPTAANNWHNDISRLLEFEKFRFARRMASLYEINEQGKIRFTASFRLRFEDRHEQQNSTRMGRFWRLYWLMNMPLDPKGLLDMADEEYYKFERFLESGPFFGIDEDDDGLFHHFLRLLSNEARWRARTIWYDKLMYTTFGGNYAKCVTQRRGTWLVLGLRKYKNSHGRWPQTLHMVSEYVPTEGFLDPISNDTFVYVLDGDGFKLYSKGKNGIDEGGRWGYVHALDNHLDDIAIWPLTKKETGDLDNDRTKQAK